MPIPISTPKILKSTSIPTSVNTPTPVANTQSAPVKQESSQIKKKKIVNEPVPEGTRIQLIRYLDDGLQTLGIMQVYDENGNELFELKSTELPYKNNISYASCIPTGKYKVMPVGNHSHYGNCFWVWGSEAGGYKWNSLPGEGNIRGDILIHEGYDAAWLQGCIAPGEMFSSDTKGHVSTKYKKYNKKYKAGNIKGNP